MSELFGVNGKVVLAIHPSSILVYPYQTFNGKMCGWERVASMGFVDWGPIHIYPKLMQITTYFQHFGVRLHKVYIICFVTSAAYSANLHLYRNLFSAFWSLTTYKVYPIFCHFCSVFCTFCGMVMRPAREAGDWKST